MKRQTHNPKQWTLEQCIEHIIKGLQPDDAATLIAAGGESVLWQVELGRWIRNSCGLWEHGTDQVVGDIIRAYKSGRLKSTWLDENRFVHPQIPFDLSNTKNMPTFVDCQLTHPDNCSAVIIEAVIQRLRNGRD